jgi:hypothetical protein
MLHTLIRLFLFSDDNSGKKTLPVYLSGCKQLYGEKVAQYCSDNVNHFLKEVYTSEQWILSIVHILLLHHYYSLVPRPFPSFSVLQAEKVCSMQYRKTGRAWVRG